ncbi:hypothetical protein Sta7437_3459 [Stanieria cyanosphaera PCC 7437]|uniref:Uncharacterized protein n=1 Tax=Stanieria cyanosphaera (strain ATCC 29371 / PCC 7437) TaxID=111780 RepID=K9XWJ1_STAC7|nr:hypothetical protein [Stanieria cyanosphaera]AFZ36960.1 hypothetical protein Sta7437_3459 [Stanieria cyanosphaera PCC 7437]
MTKKENQKILKKIDTKLDKILEEIIKLKIDLEVIKIKVEELEIRTANLESQINQVKLPQKTQNWSLTGIIGAVIVGICLAAVSLLFFAPNP